MANVTRLMTEKKALAEARKRWKNGYVRFSPTAAVQADRDALPKLTPEQVRALPKEEREKRTWTRLGYRCSVGNIVGIGIFPMFEVKGQGDTWEEALAKADEYDRKDRERYASLRK